MHETRPWTTRLLLIAMATWSIGVGAAAESRLTLHPISTFETGVFDDSATEIVAYDAASQRLFIVNGPDAAIDVLDIALPDSPTFLFAIDVTPFGRRANSVAVHDGLVAARVEAVVKQQPGRLVLFDVNGNFLSSVTVGALPDMVIFTSDEGDARDYPGFSEEAKVGDLALAWNSEGGSGVGVMPIVADDELPSDGSGNA